MSSPIQAIQFLESSAYAPGLFDLFFAGLFLVKGVPLAGQLLWMLCVPGALLAAYMERHVGRPVFGVLSRGCALVAFTVSFFFLLQPWDEVFINLRHSVHLGEDGVFSFNRLTAIEGTVDWLVYFVLGCLHRTGLPLEELAFLQGYAGALVCIVLGQRLWCTWTQSPNRTVPWLLLCFFPPLAFNSAHGFATTWFVAALMAAGYFLFFAQRRVWLGWFAVACLPLLRAEGAFFAVLLSVYFTYVHRSRWQRILPVAALVFAPFVMLCAWRLQRFGSMVPLPIQYKATGTDLFYFAVGVRNLVADSLACGTLLMALSLWCARRFNGRDFFRPGEHTALVIAAILLCGCLPYYISGGDWFPSYWGRYLFPATLWCYLLSTAIAHRVLSTRPLPIINPAILVFGVILVHSLWPISSNWKFFDHLFAHRRTLAKIHPPTIGRGHYRIQHLSQLGLHLGAYTEPTDRIASSEVATIMYFARREALDLLGVANPEIARSPVRDAPALLRRFPQASELPYLIFKRIRPDILPKERPEYLYTFDFMWRDLMPETTQDEIEPKVFFKALDRWERKLGGLMDTLYGGVGKVLEMGYRPVVVRYSNDFLSLYFVREDLLESHLGKMVDGGFRRQDWTRSTR